MEQKQLNLTVCLRGNKLWIWPRPGQSLCVTVEIDQETADHIRDLAEETDAYAKTLAGIMHAA